MIKKLTEEQKQQMNVFKNECLQKGLSTERIKKNQELEDNVEWIYKKFLNLDCPKIWYVESPLMYNLIINTLNNSFKDINLSDNLDYNLGYNLSDNLGYNLDYNLGYNLSNNLSDNLGYNLGYNLSDNLGDNLGYNLRGNLSDNPWYNLWDNLRGNLRDNLRDNFSYNLRDDLSYNLSYNLKFFNNIYWGSTDIYWLSFYMFPKKYLGIDYGDDLNNSLDRFYEFTNSIGYIFYHKDICFISERPIEIHRKNNFLHADDKPSLLFSDGYCLWNLNGVNVSKEIILTPANELDCNLVLKEKNAEIRRELVRKIGIERVIKDLGAKSIEKNDNYELLNFDIIDGSFRPYLKMINPSIDIYHIEGVHPDCNTIEKALSWRNGVVEKPTILT